MKERKKERKKEREQDKGILIGIANVNITVHASSNTAVTLVVVDGQCQCPSVHKVNFAILLPIRII